ELEGIAAVEDRRHRRGLDPRRLDHGALAERPRRRERRVGKLLDDPADFDPLLRGLPGAPPLPVARAAPEHRRRRGGSAVGVAARTLENGRALVVRAHGAAGDAEHEEKDGASESPHRAHPATALPVAAGGSTLGGGGGALRRRWSQTTAASTGSAMSCDVLSPNNAPRSSARTNSITKRPT